MATKVFDLNTAELLISRQATLACLKCGESNWTSAQPAKQTKKPGLLTVRCKTCASVRSKKLYATDEAYREAQKAYHKDRWANDSEYREAKKVYHKERYATNYEFREAHKASSNVYCKERYATDSEFREARKAYHKERYATDEAWREARNAYGLQWAKDNPGKANAGKAKYRATKLQATPPWSETDLIKEFYVNCPAGMHVDHIFPLQGELVSGLHVLENLQYLIASENLSKSNSFNLQIDW